MVLASASLLPAGCAAPAPAVGEAAQRRGDEIMIAGTLVHTGAPVVLWTDPGGYDAYRVHQRFPRDTDQPHELDGKPRSNSRPSPPGSERADAHAAGDWTLPELRQVIDQFVIHYDVCGTSRTCFRVLHDERGLSVHFMLDIDGTIYQTLDVKERAWHATKANGRSVGIEIANIGAYPPQEAHVLREWYTTDDRATRITLPERLGDGGVRTPAFVGSPDRPEPIAGTINGRELVMFDLTPQQYRSLAHLTAALNAALPGITLDAPRDAEGRVIDRVLDDAHYESYAGLLGHYHVQAGKADPGPAFQWDRLLDEAQRLRRRR
jgi:N-acetyl-anhydromuramyl-L-alanine amidase AmpD